jgi:uncharacterized protein
VLVSVELTEHQLALARRVVAHRWPGKGVGEGLVAALRERVAAGEAASAPGAAERSPPLTGPPLADVVIRPGEGLGVVVPRGHLLRIVQVGHGQGLDLIAYDRADTRRRFSAARTRALEGARPGLGADLWAGAPGETPMLTIVGDSCSAHDLTFPACSRFEYDHDAGLPDHPNCFDAQQAVVERFGLDATDVPDPLNLWLPSWLDEGGVLRSGPTVARRGDYVDLLARIDVLAVVTPCPDDVYGTSRWWPQPVRVLVAPGPRAPRLPAHAELAVVRRFPPPTPTAVAVEVEPDLHAELERLAASHRYGDDPAAALRGVFFEAWAGGGRDYR